MRGGLILSDRCDNLSNINLDLKFNSRLELGRNFFFFFVHKVTQIVQWREENEDFSLTITSTCFIFPIKGDIIEAF